MAALTGCDKSHPAPPSERNALILRFFNSMGNGDAAAASEQGEKLRKMDIGNEYIVKLISVQQSNKFLRRAQREVNAGNIDKALEILNEGVKAYPTNRDLARQRAKIRHLRHAKELLQNMQAAANTGTMSAALAAASTGLATNMTPKLQAYLDRYREKIANVANAEGVKATALEPIIEESTQNKDK
jgi:hypothetical protein